MQPSSASHDFIKNLPAGVKRAMRWLIIPPVRTCIRYAPVNFGRKMLWDSVASHAWWLETSVEAKTIFDAVLLVDAGDIVGKFIYYFGVWEPNLSHWIEGRLKPGDTFIDVGANIGYYSLLASKLVGESGTVVSIEALPKTYERLLSNARRNSARNIRAVNSAAWNCEEKLAIFTKSTNPTGTTTLMRQWADQWHLADQIEVDAKPLAKILTAGEIAAARLIKIDVEGAEWNVISEMKSWLPSCRADVEIIIELSRSMLKTQENTIQDVFDLFASFGFFPYVIENDYSAASYINNRQSLRPARAQSVTDSYKDQLDTIFSRTDAAIL
jgi:FkbM family methyltransferase